MLTETISRASVRTLSGRPRSRRTANPSRQRRGVPLAGRGSGGNDNSNVDKNDTVAAADPIGVETRADGTAAAAAAADLDVGDNGGVVRAFAEDAAFAVESGRVEGGVIGDAIVDDNGRGDPAMGTGLDVVGNGGRKDTLGDQGSPGEKRQ